MKELIESEKSSEEIVSELIEQNIDNDKLSKVIYSWNNGKYQSSYGDFVKDLVSALGFDPSKMEPPHLGGVGDQLKADGGPGDKVPEELSYYENLAKDIKNTL